MSDTDELEAKQREEEKEYWALAFCILFWLIIFAWLIIKMLINN